MRIIRYEFLYLAIGPVDVLRIAGQSDPAKRSDASAKQRTHVGRNESRKIEGIADTPIQGNLSNVVSVVERWNTGVVKVEHCAHVHGDGLRCCGDHGIGVGAALLQPPLNAPAGRQITVRRIVRRSLIRHCVRAYAAVDHPGKQFRCITQQPDRHRLPCLDRLFNHGHRLVEGFGPPIEVTRLQALVDAVRLAFDGQHRGAGHRRRKRLRPAHAAKPGGQYPLSTQVARVMLATHFHERLVGALHDPLAADVDP